MEKLPKLHFDTTLAELYALDAGEDGRKRIVLFPMYALTTIDIGPGYPKNLRYPAQDFLVQYEDPEGSRDFMGRLFKVGSMSVIPQTDSIAAGKMGVVFITFENEQQQRSYIETERTRNSVDPSQRFEPIYISDLASLDEIELKNDTTDTLVAAEKGGEANGTLTAPTSSSSGLSSSAVKKSPELVLAIRYPLAQLSRSSLTCSLDNMYFLNTKGALVTSGLPTPRSEIIQLGPAGFDPKSCCPTCAADPGHWRVPTNCTGKRLPWSQEQIGRALTMIKRRSLPFVLKLQFSYSGITTMMCRDKEEVKAVCDKLANIILPKVLSYLTPETAYLQPGNIILSDFISNLTCQWAVTFFVTQKGRPIFLGATKQRFEHEVEWRGSQIDYSEQEKLKEKFGPLMEKMAMWVNGYGYYGPLGVDILEAPKRTGDSGGRGTAAAVATAKEEEKENEREDEENELLIVDMNVRFSGSLGLVLLSQFFYSDRNFPFATSLQVQTDLDRDELVDKLPKQFSEGRIVFMGWYWHEDFFKPLPKSGGVVLVAGETEEKTQETIEELWAAGVRELEF